MAVITLCGTKNFSFRHLVKTISVSVVTHRYSLQDGLVYLLITEHDNKLVNMIAMINQECTLRHKKTPMILSKVHQIKSSYFAMKLAGNISCFTIYQ